jgi:hypothetical protein
VTFTAEADSNLVFSGITDGDGGYEVVLTETAVEEEAGEETAPSDFALFQNYPNPFNPSTVIPYRLRETVHVRLVIYNMLGQRIRTLVDWVEVAGVHTVQWDGYNDGGLGVAAGVYVVRMEAGRFVQSRKMVMVDGASGGMARTGKRLQRPLAKNIETEEAALYTVTITGEDIISFTQTGIAISEDMRLDFVVQRKPYSMVLIPAGSFQMGDAFNEGDNSELPAHTVYVDAFYIDKYDVTNAQYKNFCNATGHAYPPTSGSTWYDHVPADYFTDYPNYPVACVNWYDAVQVPVAHRGRVGICGQRRIGK